MTQKDEALEVEMGKYADKHSDKDVTAIAAFQMVRDGYKSSLRPPIKIVTPNWTLFPFSASKSSPPFTPSQSPPFSPDSKQGSSALGAAEPFVLNSDQPPT